MEFLKINLGSFKITPALSGIDEQITVDCDIESFQLHEMKLNANIKVSNKKYMKILACDRLRL